MQRAANTKRSLGVVVSLDRIRVTRTVVMSAERAASAAAAHDSTGQGWRIRPAVQVGRASFDRRPTSAPAPGTGSEIIGVSGTHNA